MCLKSSNEVNDIYNLRRNLLTSLLTVRSSTGGLPG